MKRVYAFNTLNAIKGGLGFFPNSQSSLNSTKGVQVTPFPYSAQLVDNHFTVTLGSNPISFFGDQKSLGARNNYKELFITFWENDLLNQEDEYLLTEFTSSPNQAKGLLPLFHQLRPTGTHSYLSNN
jgi:hypothetical protein